MPAFKIPNKFLDGIGNIAGNVAEGDQVQVEEAFMYILIYLKHNSTIIMQLKKWLCKKSKGRINTTNSYVA